MAASSWHLPDTARLMQGRTSFVVSHKTSTLKHCDNRLEVEHGRLVNAVRAIQQNASRSAVDPPTNTVALPEGVPRG